MPTSASAMEEYEPLNADMSPEEPEPASVQSQAEERPSFDHAGTSGIALTPREMNVGVGVHPRNPQEKFKEVEEEEARLPLFAGTLFAITFPVQILFLLFIHFSGWVVLNWSFVFVFMIMFSISVSLSIDIFLIRRITLSFKCF